MPQICDHFKKLNGVRPASGYYKNSVVFSALAFKLIKISDFLTIDGVEGKAKPEKTSKTLMWTPEVCVCECM